MFGSYNVLGKEKKHEKRGSDDDRLPVPLNIQSINISKAIREEQRETERETHSVVSRAENRVHNGDYIGVLGELLDS